MSGAMGEQQSGQRHLIVERNLNDWVREAYLESCAYYGEPPTALPNPTPTAFPEIIEWPWKQDDIISPELMLELLHWRSAASIELTFSRY